MANLTDPSSLMWHYRYGLYILGRDDVETTTNAEDPRRGDAGLASLLDVAGRDVSPAVPETRQPARLALPPRPRQSGVKAVLARLPMFDLGLHVPDQMQSLIAVLKRDSPKVDVRAVLRAYRVADAAHEGQCRKSGEPFIMHPIGVAEVLAKLGMDTAGICAALLHDTVEDTDLILDDIAREFGGETAMLVDGVTKLNRIQVPGKEDRQAESLRKMLIAMAEDNRVLAIKLADRLHNMRTIHHMPRDSQKRIAQETLRIYAPLAHRLGMQNFRSELEDLAFMTLHPKRYDEIKAMVAERQPERDRYLEKVVAEVTERLRAVKIRAEVSGRHKHYWSIYEKMFMRGKEFAEIYDLVGIRVIVDSVKECYAALGTIHGMYRPIPGRFKDYIAMPKFNLYQSLHTTVVGSDGKPLEVQIRTIAMHRTAEYGIAAHWKYKQAKVSGDDIAPPSDIGEAQWLRQMLDMQSDTKDPAEFLRNIRGDLEADEVFVFTPKGDIKALPRTSTPVDFAYAIHTDVGHRTIGARVNGRLTPLDYELRNGDTVEILVSTAVDAGPSADWLGFVGSSRARSKIKHWFSHERRIDAIAKGRDELKRALEEKGPGWKHHLGTSEFRAVAEALGYADLDALYRAVGEGHRSARSVVGHVSQRITDDSEQLGVPLPSSHEASTRASDAIVVQDTDNVWVTLARCCSPVPYDSIVGLTTNRSVSVHRSSCPYAEDMSKDPERLVPVHWDTRAPTTFRVNLQVEALDRKRLLRDITTVLGDLQVNLISAQLTTQRNRVAYLRFAFELADLSHLEHIIAQIRRVESVFDTYRISPGPNS
jgi:GTP diphosphokinase / guanosine-3',5'-bis(diphosphate) 3'-diphosphatase